MAKRTPKGELMYCRLVDAAMKSFALNGDRGTTFQSIADLSGVSQPLVAKYFKTRDAVFPAAVDKFIADARRDTVKALSEASNPADRLKEYIRVSIRICRERPENYKIYILLHYYAAFDEKYKEMNSEIKRVAVDRITKIVDEGAESGVFRRVKNSRLVAKAIHCAIVGVLLSITSEYADFTDKQLETMLLAIADGYLSLKPS